MLEKQNENVVCTSLCPTCPRSGLEKKNDFICGLCKKEKCDTKISLFVAHFFVLSTANKNICFHKTMRDHIEYGDVHANIFS
jgi:hypothetical protein